MRLEMNSKSILLGIFSIPALVIGISALALAIFRIALSSQPFLEKLNDLEIYYLIMLSFGLVAISSIIASRVSYFENQAIRNIFKYSMIICSLMAGMMFVYSALLFVLNGT